MVPVACAVVSLLVPAPQKSREPVAYAWADCDTPAQQPVNREVETMSIYEPMSSDGARRRLQLRSPVTLEPTGELVCADREDVAAAIRRAREAQPAWAALSFKERAAIMDRACRLVVEKADMIMDTVVAETGKARTDALSMEVFSVADSLCYYAKNAEKFLKPRTRKVHGGAWLYQETAYQLPAVGGWWG